MCFECHHDNLCGGVSRKDYETMKIGDVEKLLKVVIKKNRQEDFTRNIYIYIYIGRFLTDIIYVLLHIIWTI